MVEPARLRIKLESAKLGEQLLVIGALDPTIVQGSLELILGGG